MEDGETSVQLSGVFHLICGRPDSRGGMAAVCGNPISVWALQTAATHLMKSPFCGSVRWALPRILKKSVALPVLAVAAMIVLAVGGLAAFSTLSTSPLIASARGD